jgi:hypothetical protein
LKRTSKVLPQILLDDRKEKKLYKRFFTRAAQAGPQLQLFLPNSENNKPPERKPLKQNNHPNN